MERWRCLTCGYVYEPAAGDPEGGVPPKTPFAAIPDDWVCPQCGVRKGMFRPLPPVPNLGGAEPA